jgi:hypothetical protein
VRPTRRPVPPVVLRELVRLHAECSRAYGSLPERVKTATARVGVALDDHRRPHP